MFFCLFLILTAFIGAVVSFYLWQWTFWRRRGVPGPPSIPVLGNKLSLMSKDAPAALVLRDWTTEYGKTYGIQEGIQQVLVTSDPVILLEVFQNQFENFHGRKLFIPNDPKAKRVHLVGASGNRWKRLRTISSHAFTTGSLKKIHAIVENSALDLLSFIEKNSSEVIDFDKYYHEYTMDIINRVAMGQTESKMFNDPMLDVFSQRFDSIAQFIGTINVILPEAVTNRIDLRILGKLFKKKHPVVQITEKIEKAVHNRIEQREKDLAAGIEQGEPIDFIDLFLDARSEEFFEETQGEEFTKAHKKVSRQMTTDEVIAQCLVFMVAGFDTTAFALSFTTHLLATHPDVQKKVQDEISRECQDSSIDFDSLTRLKYLDAVIKETLRLFPLSSSLISRKCTKDTIVGETKIEKGTFVQADVWTLHYDKKLWGENAEEFVPERWLEGDVNKNNWLPFGHGPRQCIAMRLAMIEEKLLLAHLFRKYTIVPRPETKKLKLIGPVLIQPESCSFKVVERV